ncbi:leucyl/phenylalanyl-tRNA--protein transferase [Paracidovorax avenae]|uniref:leucyl/phenylalanyl-tRNA--protein transferase n=1 Tax=Paracidovorax avenae TaxID=80867 RepID=UPI000D15C5DE|nr:leucyl/phenylalanyl-tRNA--protein transferase [Paracidovorax avenae]AVT16337.1 leucyl/phenylalanyl-tRNA--protein transferase [Paracidovorax avenae]
MPTPTPLAWLEPDDPFPPAAHAWGPGDPAPGLLAAGGALDTAHLRQAYAQGIFPWFSAGQPILWWSPDPRMVLHVESFRLHRSLRRTLQHFRTSPGCEIRVDHSFPDVIRACAQTPRGGQHGTWIVPDMIAAYEEFHRAGHAHSIETWQDGRLVGGLYCIGIGRAVFGESMFAHVTDASKIALAALVCLCRRHGAEWIDCQQNTAHLASLGAREIPRERFLRNVQAATVLAPITWRFDSLYWDALLPPSPGPQ